ncbi:MAG: hypothetical protein ACJ8ER_08000 [Allosphingosinicella sp.]
MIVALLPLAMLLADAPSKPRLICRGAQPTVGTRIKSRKVCHTEEEWKELDGERRGADIHVQTPQPDPWERTRPQ